MPGFDQRRDPRGFSYQISREPLFSSVFIAETQCAAMENTQKPVSTDAVARSEYTSQGLEMANQAWNQPPFSIRSDSEMDKATSIER